MVKKKQFDLLKFREKDPFLQDITKNGKYFQNSVFL